MTKTYNVTFLVVVGTNECNPPLIPGARDNIHVRVPARDIGNDAAIIKAAQSKLSLVYGVEATDFKVYDT